MSVDEDVEGTDAIDQGQEGDAGRDLTDYISDLLTNLLLILSRVTLN